MTITFDITDVSGLSSRGLEQRVSISGLNCDSAEIALAQHLSDVVVRAVADFRNKTNNTTKDTNP